MKLVTLLFALVLLPGIAIRAATPQSAGLRIEGIVVRADTGEPVSGAKVILEANPITTGNGSFEDRAIARRGKLAVAPFIITDGGGRFSFKDLPVDGGYGILVRANGFAPDGEWLNLKPGETVKDLTFKLVRTGTISGHVRDRSGQPIPNFQVQLIQREYESYGQGDSKVIDIAETNDRGEYRIFGIPAGRYYLLAGSGLPPYLSGVSWLAGNPNQLPDSFGYSFYPDVPVVDEATAMVVHPGADLAGLDFAMTRKTPHRIRGRVIDSRTGRAPASAEIAIVERNSAVVDGATFTDEVLARFGARTTYEAASGALNIRDLGPGNYTVRAKVVDQRPRGVSSDFREQRSFGSATVAVKDSDVEDIVIMVFPLGSISGRIAVEGGERAAIRVDQFGVQLESVIPGGPTADSGYAKPDGTFRIEDVAQGDYRVVVVNGFQQKAYIREVRRDGVDMLSRPLRFAGIASGDLDVRIGANGGQVYGTVTDDRGKPAPSVWAVLIPDRLRNRPDLFKTVKTDDAGRYTLTQVAPGAYKIFSWEGIEPYAWFDPKFLEPWESRGVAVRVSESGRETVDVQLIPSGGIQ